MKLRYEKCMSSRAFKEPKRNIQDYYLKIDGYIKQLENIINKKVKEKNTKYVEIVSKLDALSPLKTLTRGYSIIEKNRKIVKSVIDLKKDDKIELKLQDGNKDAKII